MGSKEIGRLYLAWCSCPIFWWPVRVLPEFGNRFRYFQRKTKRTSTTWGGFPIRGILPPSKLLPGKSVLSKCLGPCHGRAPGRSIRASANGTFREATSLSGNLSEHMGVQKSKRIGRSSELQVVSTGPPSKTLRSSSMGRSYLSLDSLSGKPKGQQRLGSTSSETPTIL